MDRLLIPNCRCCDDTSSSTSELAWVSFPTTFFLASQCLCGLKAVSSMDARPGRLPANPRFCRPRLCHGQRFLVRTFTREIPLYDDDGDDFDGSDDIFAFHCHCIESERPLTFNNHRYGFHMPRTHARDAFYSKVEQEKAEKRGQA